MVQILFLTHGYSSSNKFHIGNFNLKIYGRFDSIWDFFKKNFNYNENFEIIMISLYFRFFIKIQNGYDILN